jgi:GAF domain-containing protein
MSEQRNSDTSNPSSRPAQELDLAARLEILNGLLNTLTDVLDVREVFELVSNVVQRVLPHDLMGVMEISEAGDRIRLYAGAGSAQTHTPTYDVAVPESFKLLTQPWDAQIIEDFRNHPLAQGSPAFKVGMITVLSAPIRFGGRLQAAVNFFSRQTGWFRRGDLPIAERIASHIALVMSHHRLAEEARQRQELEALASKLDLLDQSLASLTVRDNSRMLSIRYRELYDKFCHTTGFR